MPVVKLYANLRTITGKKELNIPGSNIQEVLGQLSREYPGVEKFLLEGDRLRPRVIISLNGQILNTQSCFQADVSERDKIAIFPPVSGG